jgi:haloacetate dehalogenase
LKKTIPGALSADAFPEDIVREYIRYYSDPRTVHAIAEDYRASRTIDWTLDMADRAKKIKTPILCIWGSDGNISKLWDVVAIWQNLAENVTGLAVKGCGHFVPEEKPAIVAEALINHMAQFK